MAIVDTLSSPATNTDFDANANFNIIFTFTYETGTYVSVLARRTAWNDYGFKCECSTIGALQVGYYDGTYTQTTYAGSTFADGIEYTVECQGSGSSIEVYVNDSELTGGDTITHNTTVAQGRIEHTLATNDIELESWPYGEPDENALIIDDATHVHTADNVVFAQGNVLDVDDTAHAHSCDGQGEGDGLWEVGAYIFPIETGIILETSGGALVTADASHAHTAESPALTQANTLSVDDCLHLHTADAPSFTQSSTLDVDDAAHSLRTQNIILSGPGFPAEDDSSFAVLLKRRRPWKRNG